MQEPHFGEQISLTRQDLADRAALDELKELAKDDIPAGVRESIEQ